MPKLITTPYYMDQYYTVYKRLRNKYERSEELLTWHRSQVLLLTSKNKRIDRQLWFSIAINLLVGFVLYAHLP